MGFAGLTELVSDVDAMLTQAKRSPDPAPVSPMPAPQRVSESAPQPSQQEKPNKPEVKAGSSASPVVSPSETQKPQHSSTTQPGSKPRPALRQQAPHHPQAGGDRKAAAQPTGTGSAAGWLVGIGAVVGLIWIASESENNSTSPGPMVYQSPSQQIQQHPSTSVPDWTTPPASTPAPAQRQPPIETPAWTAHTPETTPAQTPTERPRPQPDATVRAIQRRLNALGYNAGIADGIAGANTTSAIMAFQKDHNFIIDGIASLALLNQVNLAESQSRNAFYQPNINATCRRYKNGITVVVPCQDNEVSSFNNRPSPDSTVQAIQRRLNSLGYNAGVADGFSGNKTRSAIIAFQKDHDLYADGIPSVELLDMANSVSGRPRNAPSAQSPRVEYDSVSVANNQDQIPDLSRLSYDDRQSIEAACSVDKYIYGPDYYKKCLSSQLKKINR